MTEQPGDGGWGDPSGNPYAPGTLAGFDPRTGWGDGNSPQPQRPWWKAPGQLIGAATFSAVFAWVAFLCAALNQSVLTGLDKANPLEQFVLGFFALILLGIVWLVGMTALVLAGMGLVATVPLAVVWFRDPDRTIGAGLAMLHAVVAWGFVGSAVSWIL